MKFKKLFAGLGLSLAVAVSGSVFSAGCAHRHEGNVAEDIPATCTEDGLHIVYCESCGEIRFQDVIPATGHKFLDYSGSASGNRVEYCTACGEPDPDSNSFVSGENYGDTRLSDDGVLSWGRLKEAVKYEISLTYSGADVPQKHYVDKTRSSVKLDELTGGKFPAGKTTVKFTPYAAHKETIDGETVKQEYPMDELADEFIVTKLNSEFSAVRLGYSDEHVTMDGFYSDAREDEYGNSYYLLEQLLTDNKATQFNVSRKIKTKSGMSVKYYRTEKDRAEQKNALSSMAMQFEYIKAGYNAYYAQVTGNGITRDYNLKVYGLQKLTLGFYQTITTYEDGYRKDSYVKTGEQKTYIEGDIIPKETLFADNGNRNGARDESYNFVDYGDYVVTAPSAGSNVNLYFSDTVREDCDAVGEWKKYYNLSETENGWILSNSYSQSENKRIEVPDSITGKRVISAQFYYSDIEHLTVAAKRVLLSFTSCTALVEATLLSSVEYLQSGAFKGANSNLKINCRFSADYALNNFAEDWNSKDPTSIYSGKFVTVYD